MHLLAVSHMQNHQYVVINHLKQIYLVGYLQIEWYAVT